MDDTLLGCIIDRLQGALYKITTILIKDFLSPEIKLAFLYFISFLILCKIH